MNGVAELGDFDAWKVGCYIQISDNFFIGFFSDIPSYLYRGQFVYFKDL